MSVAHVSTLLNVQTQEGHEVTVDDLERLWLNGLQFGDNVPVGLYQHSAFVTEQDDSDPIEAHNVEYVDNTHAKVDVFPWYGRAIYGGDFYGAPDTHSPTTVALPLLVELCQLHVLITSDIPIQITSAKFYAYDGITDTTPYRGIDFKAVEGGVSTSWTSANGSSQALVCQNHSSALSHEYFIGVSASPTSTGDKQGKLKFLFTYSQS